jgi:hypothetical protein
MNLIRIIGLLGIGWTVVALGAGLLGVGSAVPSEPGFFIARQSVHDALQVAAPPAADTEEYRLVDRTSGQLDRLRVPENDRWGLIAVSPWHDPEGDLEAVGRWARRTASAPAQEFCGLGVFRLSDGTVKYRVATDLLPTGRPCWVPGRRGEFLFPAADGQLYRWRAGGRSGDFDEHEESGPTASRRGSMPDLQVVQWRCERPGAGATFLNDPVWLWKPGSGRFVIVALSLRQRTGAKSVYRPPTLWWLEISPQGDAIVAAGPLTRLAREGAGTERIMERFPNIAAAGERIRLVHLKKVFGKGDWSLCSSELEIDRATGGPRIKSTETEPRVLASTMAPAFPVLACDGQRVYATDASGGVKSLAIPR